MQKARSLFLLSDFDVLMEYFGSCVLVRGWDDVLETGFDERTTLIPVIIVCLPSADYRSIVRNLPDHLTNPLYITNSILPK